MPLPFEGISKPRVRVRGDIRSALSHVSRNTRESGIVGVEIILIAIVAGLHWHSILLGAGAFALLFFLWRYRPITIVAAFLLTAAWAYIGWFIGSTSPYGMEAGIVAAAVGFLIGYAIHLRGLGLIRGLS